MSIKPLTNEELIKKITSGQYRDFYLIYGRRSTDDLENQKNSLKYQREENQRFAYRNNLPIAQITVESFCTNGIISERHSAFKEEPDLVFTNGSVQYQVDRPKFYKMVEWLSKGYFKGVIILCWDRATRNKGDDTIIRKLLKMGVDIRFVLANYDKSSAGELHMDIDGMFAIHRSRDTSEKVSISLKNKRSQGVCTYRAPVGYLNQGTMEYKPIDPARAPLIVKMFDMYATGDWSLSDLARWAIEQNFTMPAMRRRRTEEEVLAEEEDDVRLDIAPVERLATYNNVHKILTNLFYTGKVLSNDGVWMESSSHEAIISEELFYRVQSQLHKKNKSAHYAEVLGHPLRGLVRCAVCKRVYTPYPKKGIMYYGARCSETCTNTNNHFNIGFITDKIGELIKNLSFTDDELEKLDARTSTEIGLLEARRLNELETNERKKKKIREDLAYLNTNRISLLKTGVFTPEAMVEEERKLNLELSALQQYETSSDLAIRETVKAVVKLSELIKNLYLLYENANPHEKESIIKELFSELTINGEVLEYQCKKGLQPLANRFVAICDPIVWISELVSKRDYILSGIQSLEMVLAGTSASERI